MQSLLNFILRNRAFFTFLVLELICAWLLVRQNAMHGARFFNSSNAAAARTLKVSQDVNDYLHLKVVNEELNRENARLRTALLQKPPSANVSDSSMLRQFDFVAAKVVSNSVSLNHNFITIDAGRDQKIEPGMAVINANKAIGKVKSVSDNFSVVMPLLNLDQNVSTLVARTGHFGTLKWDGRHPRFSSLLYIPRHAQPLPGDSVVTSGHNVVFPRHIWVGIIHTAELKPNEQFWNITVELAQDFGKLQYVQVVRSLLKPQLDSLEQAIEKLP